MNEQQKERIRGIWVRMKELHGETWPKVCKDMRGDFMAGVSEAGSIMGRAILTAFRARREGDHDLADFILALGYEFSQSEKEGGA